MTSEELILLLDSLQQRLPKCANQVLLRLVAKCITGGSNEVEISAAAIALELGMSEDSVKVAKRALAALVTTRGEKGNATTWTLPADWFVMQRSLFAVDSPVEKWPTALETRAPTALETRAHRPGNQGTPPWKPGHTALETRALWTSFQGTTALETRAVSPEINDLTPTTALETRALSIDRDRALSSLEGVLHLRDSIEGVNWLPETLRTEGEELKRWLRGFYVKHHSSHTAPDGPDEIILAKCFAIADPPRLAQVLKSLDKKATRPGDTWAWFVTVFCQRIKGTKDTKAVPAPTYFRQEKKTPSAEGGADFGSDLLSKISSAVGKVH